MSVERIGNLMAGLNRIAAGSGSGEGYTENTRCGGALLLVTKEQAIGIAEKGFRWKMDPEKMPDEGRHSWRVSCDAEVLQVTRTSDLPMDATDEERERAPKYVVTYALCSRCSGYEIGMRKKLKQAAIEKAQTMSGPKKRRFAEPVSE